MLLFIITAEKSIWGSCKATSVYLSIKIGRKHLPKLKQWKKKKKLLCKKYLRKMLEATDPYLFEKLFEIFFEECKMRTMMWRNSEHILRRIMPISVNYGHIAINTNMYLKAFHKVLNHTGIYMYGKVNKRIDMCVLSFLLCHRKKL